MPKDYKDRIPAYRRRKPRRAARAWGLAAAALLGVAGLGALGLSFFSGNGGEQEAPAATDMPMPPQAAAPLSPGETKPTAPAPLNPPGGKKANAPEAPPPLPVEPRFTFYKVLPEKEVIIQENEIKTLKREEETQGKAPTAAAAAYMVQAGSFSRQQDAENLKAQLAQIKVKAKLEMIQLESAAWFRVKIGPYATLADADKVRQYLRANKIDSVVQKATH